jgi:hypothetical protein
VNADQTLIVKFIEGLCQEEIANDAGQGGLGGGVQTDCKVKGYIGLQIKSAGNKLFHRPNNVNSSNNMTLSSHFLRFLVLLSMFLLYRTSDLTLLEHY